MNRCDWCGAQESEKWLFDSNGQALCSKECGQARLGDFWMNRRYGWLCTLLLSPLLFLFILLSPIFYWPLNIMALIGVLAGILFMERHRRISLKMQERIPKGSRRNDSSK
jgi:hypothetical protein